MASAMYNNYKKHIGSINWSDNAGINIRVMLVDSNYSVDIDLHLTKADITDEVIGTAYTAGGELLTGRTIVADNVNDWSEYDTEDVVWANSTIVASGAIVYLDTGVDNTSTLISYIDFGASKSSSEGDFTIQWHGDGVFRIA